MKKKKWIDVITFSPLLLLVLLPIINRLAGYLGQAADHPEIAIQKYVSIPLIGFSFGWAIFLGVLRNGWELPSQWCLFMERRSSKIIVGAGSIFLVCFLTLSVLRYASLHSSSFDLGVYDQKTWLMAGAPLSGLLFESARLHFQPIMILLGLIYKLSADPVILEVFQTTAVLSGVIPLYFIARRLLPWHLLLVTCMIYFLYPSVTFNASNEFHPDALYIPFMLWAFYFAEDGRYAKAIIFAGIGAMAKEPYILGAAFFGLYLCSEKKQYRTGLMTFAFYSLMFLAVVFLVLPHVNPTSPFYREFPVMESGNRGLATVFSMLLTYKIKKIMFLYFLLFPLLFLPLFEWKRFLPAVPIIAISVLSTNDVRSNVDSQYAIGVFVPAFVALVFALKKIETRYGLKYANAFAIFALLMTFTFHIAHSASPLSLSFWKPGWSGSWHMSNYIETAHEKVIKEAILKIPADPNVEVVSQGNINSARLAHRYKYWTFPAYRESADYILLSLKGPFLVGDRINETAYFNELNKIKSNPGFKLELERDGVLLFKKMS